LLIVYRQLHHLTIVEWGFAYIKPRCCYFTIIKPALQRRDQVSFPRDGQEMELNPFASSMASSLKFPPINHSIAQT
jgi:hypothetical protein